MDEVARPNQRRRCRKHQRRRCRKHACNCSIFEKWIDRSEAKLGMYDLSRRILLAIAFRHTGQTQKAVEVSEVVNEHGKYPNDQGCIAILCTTRAASLMDIAESGSPSPCEILARARKSLNRANAIRNSEEVMLTYRRMKTLDQRYGCEGGRV